MYAENILPSEAVPLIDCVTSTFTEGSEPSSSLYMIIGLAPWEGNFEQDTKQWGLSKVSYFPCLHDLSAELYTCGKQHILSLRE